MKSLKKYLKNPETFYYYFNRFVRHPFLRNLFFIASRATKPRGDTSHATPQDIARLKKDGIILWDQLIDAPAVEKIRDYLLTKQVFDLRKFNAGEGTAPINLNEITSDQNMKLHYFDKDIAECKEIVDIANDPKILSIVSGYLGCKPTIALMSAWWTKAGKTASKVFYDDMFHRDVADYKFVKLFVYLTDVTPKSGAHCFVKGSHLSAKCIQRRTFSEDEVDAAFDKNDQLLLTGKSGGAFLEDTWGLHRAMPSSEGERLVLHVMYNVMAFNPEAPPEPVAKNTYGVDPYINRVYLS